MVGTKLGRCPSESSVDGDDVDAGGSDELVDDLIGSLLQRADEDLGVDARADEELVACLEVRLQNGNSASVLGVGGVEERDQQISVKGYARHSLRNSLRCPVG